MARKHGTAKRNGQKGNGRQARAAELAASAGMSARDEGTGERRSHDRVAAETLVEGGAAQRVVRCEDTVGRLRRNGTITPAQAQAARWFHRRFLAAGYDPVRARSMECQKAQAGRRAHMGVDAMTARRQVAQALDLFGGMASLAASALWFVVGCQMPVADWARRERLGHGRPLNERFAHGVLVAALDALVPHVDDTTRC